MSSYFEDFTDEEYAKYSELFNYNTELEDGKIRVWGGEDSYLILVKHNEDIYIEVDECEGMFFEDGDNIYYTDPVWWTKLNDLDQLVEDVKNSVELCYAEYQ